MTAEQITALALLVPALVAGFISLRKELQKVHTLVNSQLDQITERLDRALADVAERDAKIEELEEPATRDDTKFERLRTDDETLS